jgi:hypothetical protein
MYSSKNFYREIKPCTVFTGARFRLRTEADQAQKELKEKVGIEGIITELK